MVNHDSHGQVFVLASAQCVGIASWRLEALGVDNELSTIQKLVTHFDRSIEISAPIVGEVDDHLLHALLGEAGKGIHHLVVGLCPEVGNAHIARLVINHIASIDTVQGYLVACDAESDQVGRCPSAHLDGDLGSLFSSQTFHDIVALHLDSCNECVIDHDDAVAGQNAHPLAGSARYGLNDIERVFLHVKLYAYAAELAL